MLSTAESILGPYVWGVYDLLVLPPSFPYGGMENPCLTFVTPTCLVSSLAGDSWLIYYLAVTLLNLHTAWLDHCIIVYHRFYVNRF